MPLLEICVPDVESALAARDGGADRIELCADPPAGGVTPGCGSIAVARRRLTIPVHVLIRPRPGDFLYSDAEFEAMRHDVRAAKHLGAAGVVLGLLRSDRLIDAPRTADLIREARPMTVTFHKAFDELADPEAGLEQLVDLGIERVLTSGQAPTAARGIDRLARFVRQAAGRLAVMAGGSITIEDIPALRAAGLREIHVGSAAAPGGRVEADRVRRLVAEARAGRNEGRNPLQ